MGRRFAAQDVHASAESGLRLDPAGIRDLGRGAVFPQLGLRTQDILGALILFVGIGGEALADAQLKNFRTDSANKGRFCDAGLWRSRGERYRDSRSRTSMFFPLPPQQGVVT
jgi:steroid 5-alpha reductase family enzyme